MMVGTTEYLMVEKTAPHWDVRMALHWDLRMGTLKVSHWAQKKVDQKELMMVVLMVAHLVLQRVHHWV
jgi:hypothetical protein